MAVLVTCEYCGKLCEKYPSAIKEHSFCSSDCFHKWLAGQQDKKVKVTCGSCLKPFSVSPSMVHSKYGNFCSRKCLNQYRSQEMRGKPGKSPSVIVRRKIAASLSGRVTYIRTSETKEKVRLRAKELNYVNRLRKGRTIRPNKQERRLLNILNGYWPLEWKYTGDGSFTLGHFIPDFVNCNSRKLIIELFGDYWHTEEDEVIKRDAYQDYGYRLLVIWEHELKSEQAVVAKIEQFMKRRS